MPRHPLIALICFLFENTLQLSLKAHSANLLTVSLLSYGVYEIVKNLNDFQNKKVKTECESP